VAITASQIRDAFPEFAGLTDARINLFISQADRRINAAAWSAKADDGRLYLTAHLLSVTADGSTADAGPVSSEKTLTTSATYAIGSVFSDDALGSTSYGRYYIGLRRTIFSSRKI
jgi:hypothetical protein